MGVRQHAHKSPGDAQSHCLLRWKESLPISRGGWNATGDSEARRMKGNLGTVSKGRARMDMAIFFKRTLIPLSSLLPTLITAWNNSGAGRNNTLSQSQSAGSPPVAGLQRTHFLTAALKFVCLARRGGGNSLTLWREINEEL